MKLSLRIFALINSPASAVLVVPGENFLCVPKPCAYNLQGRRASRTVWAQRIVSGRMTIVSGDANHSSQRPSNSAGAFGIDFLRPSQFVWDEGTFGHDIRIPLFAGIGYVIVIFSLQLFMRQRKALELKSLSAIHNGLLSLFSLMVFGGQAYETVLAVQRMGVHDVFCWQQGGPAKGSLFYWAYLFYLSKYYEFLDTVLLVLTKKPVIFLHGYHHAIVPISAWLSFSGWYMPLVTGCLFNSAVHIVMYYYYMLANLGIRPWWKKHLTKFQIVQFSSGGFFTVAFYVLYFQNLSIVESPGSFSLSFNKGCHGDLVAVICTALVNVSFLLLFCQFYVSTYKRPRSSAKPDAKQE